MVGLMSGVPGLAPSTALAESPAFEPAAAREVEVFPAPGVVEGDAVPAAGAEVPAADEPVAVPDAAPAPPAAPPPDPPPPLPWANSGPMQTLPQRPAIRNRFFEFMAY
jgi:hypothetical protein